MRGGRNVENQVRSFQGKKKKISAMEETEDVGKAKKRRRRNPRVRTWVPGDLFWPSIGREGMLWSNSSSKEQQRGAAP